jgi:hypothetical protein
MPAESAAAAGSRRQHIQSVFRVFRRRGVSGEESMSFMAGFLDSLFGSGGAHALAVQPCRHCPGGRHYARAIMGLAPCVTGGTRDGGKAPKLVVSDIRKKARAFCRSRGRGTILPWDGTELRAVSEEAEEAYEESLESQWDEDDEPVDAVGAGRDAWAGNLDSDPVRDSSAESTRRTTGCRAYVFTFLWGKRRDPALFMRAVRDLCAVGDFAVDVLHLCGCGLPDGRSNGCCEPTHLVLGSREQNSAHRSFHEVVRQINQPDNYRGVVRVLNADVQYCGDTF